MKSALEIAHEAKLRPIAEIASAAGIQPDELEQSGQSVARSASRSSNGWPRNPMPSS